MTLRIGILGLTWPGDMYREVCENIPGVEVTAIADAQPQNRERLKDRNHAWFDTPEALLEAKPCDAVIIAVPALERERVAKLVISKRIPFLLHKPMSLTHCEAEGIAQLAKQSGIQCMVGLTGRFHPEFKAAHDALKQGMIGDIVSMSERIHFGFADKSLHKHLKNGARGVGLNEGIHTFDRLHYFTGSHIASVEGLTKSNKHLGEPLEDYTAGVAVLENGLKVPFSLRFTDNDDEDYVFQIIGTKGMLTVEGFKRCVLKQGNKETVLFQHDLAKDFRSRHLPGFKAKTEHFVRLLQGKETENFIQQGLDAHRAVELLYS